MAAILSLGIDEAIDNVSISFEYGFLDRGPASKMVFVTER